jgi:hypothetical protein
MAKKKVAEEKRNTRMTTEQLPKQSKFPVASAGASSMPAASENWGQRIF